MEDKDFDKKFPELAKVKRNQEKQENKVAEIPLDGGESISGAEDGGREDVKTRFMNGLLKCTNFSQETMALLSLVNPNGEGGDMFWYILWSLTFSGLGNQDTSDPNSKVFVDPAALSSISEVEYDYSDLYDDDEDDDDEEQGDGEAGKSRRDIKEDEEITSRIPQEYISTEKPARKMKPQKIVNKKKQAILKEDKVSYFQSSEESRMSESEKISVNVIRSAEETEQIFEEGIKPDGTSQDNIVSSTNRAKRIDNSESTTKSMLASNVKPTTSEPSKTPLKPKENPELESDEAANGSDVEFLRTERLKRELSQLQGLFEATMAALSREDISDPSAHRVAWRLRIKRADKETESMLTNETQPDKDACVVRNMTCVRFPSRKHCKGIALGRWLIFVQLHLTCHRVGGH